MFKIEQLFELGFHYGHRKWRSNPKMNEFIFCKKWGISVIDLCKTALLFENALNALYDCARKNGKILFVGTKHQANELIEHNTRECSQYYINKRWLGGTLTNNFSTIHLPLNKLMKMEKDEDSGYINKFTKKERLDFQKKKIKLIDLLKGIRNLSGLPDMLIVVDPKREGIAIREAKLMNIPVVALADTDTPEPSWIKYIVPGNDEGKAAIEFFLGRCRDAVNQALQDVQTEQNIKKTEKFVLDKITDTSLNNIEQFNKETE